MDVTAATDAAHPSYKKPSRKGKDELNLATMPLSVLTHQQPTDTERKQKHYSRSFAYTVYDDQINQWVPAKVTLESNPRVGLPTPGDEALLIALFNLALETDHLAHQRFEFVPNQLFKLMGRSPNRASYNLLQQQLARLASTKVICEYAWFDVPQKQYLTEYVFGMIADYKLHRSKQTKNPNTPQRSQNFVVFDPELYRQLTTGTLKPLDLEFYFSLKLPTSRRMYRSLDRFFYRRKSYSTDLRNFAHGNLGMAEGYNIGKLKSKIKPAIDELVMRDYFLPADNCKRYTKVKKGIWRINFDMPATTKPRSKPKTKLDPLANQLVERGVIRTAARQLVDQHPADHIKLHIEIFDWHQSRGESKTPGFLRNSIEEDYTIPNGFKTAAQQQATARTKQQKYKAERAEDADRELRRENRRKLDKKIRPLWDAATADERNDIISAVAKNNFERVQLTRTHTPSFGCVQELARRLNIEMPEKL